MEGESGFGFEQEPFGGEAQDVGALVSREKVDAIGDQRNGIFVGMIHDLKRAITFPHEPAGAVGGQELADHWNHVRVRRLLGPEGVIGPNFDVGVFVVGQIAEGFDFGGVDGAAGADPAEVVDDDRGIGVKFGHSVDFSKAGWIDQAGDDLPGSGRFIKHQVETMWLEPFV